MAFQHNSPWDIIDPSSRRNDIESYKSDQSKQTYLDVPLPIQRKQAKKKSHINQIITEIIPEKSHGKISYLERSKLEKPKLQPPSLEKTKLEKPKIKEHRLEKPKLGEPIIKEPKLGNYSEPPQCEQKKKKGKTLEYCLKAVKEIDAELDYYKDSIYSEKLKVLQSELLSIDNGSHPDLVDKERQAYEKYKEELKKIQTMYDYEIERVNSLFSEEEQVIENDIERQIGYAQKILRSEIHNIHPQSFTKKRKDEPPGKEIVYKKIYLSKKVSKLQSVHERQHSKNKSLFLPTPVDNPQDDYDLIKKKILENQKKSQE